MIPSKSVTKHKRGLVMPVRARRQMLGVCLGTALTLSATGVTHIYAPPPAIAQRSIESIARQVTVRIDGPAASGSGVIVNRNSDNTYSVLTNWHAVDRPGTYTVNTADGRDYSVDSSDIIRVGGLDLAIVPFRTSRDYETARIGDASTLALGQPVFVSGWRNPTRELATATYRLIPGSISGVAPQADALGYSLIFSAPGAFTGVSGGPILTPQGQVVGILGRGEQDLLSGAFTGQYLGLAIDLYLRSSYQTTTQITPEPVVLPPGLRARPGRPPVITPSLMPSAPLICAGPQIQC